ncbi:MAG: hypothetical protein ACR2PA_27110, partial [Hyphomicrobiaceae bacterium]
ILISSLAAYLLQTARNRGRKSGQKYPRLIVPSILPFVSIALAIGGVSIIAACNCPLVLEQCEPVTCDLVYEPSEWIIANAATLLAIGGVVIQFAHGRFDVAIDIVNFFKSNRGHRRFNPLSAVASVFRFAPGDSSEFRPQLKRRLDELVDDLIVARGPFKRIIFVGHSLGSMIAIDGLATARGSTAADSVELVTMGSPYRSIFNYYFPHMFPPPSLTGLAGVRSWTNIYRENDFVGTNLDNGSGDIEDIAEPPHGHIGYFSDEAVAKKIALLALMGRTVESAREPATV